MDKDLNIYQKLIEVRKAVPYLKKDNSGGQWNYVSSSQTLGSLRDKMDELGLLLVPEITGKEVAVSSIEQFDKTTGNVTKRTNTYFTELSMKMMWINADKPSETIACNWYGQGVDIGGEKGVGKALTYAEKYFLLKFFNIPTDKDDPDAFQKKTETKAVSVKNNTKEAGIVSWLEDEADKQVASLDKLATWYKSEPVQAEISTLSPVFKKQINSYVTQLKSTIA